MKIKDPSDVVIGYIVHSNGHYKIEDADQVERWKLQRQNDGDWKLKDSADSLVYRIKKRDYGYEIEDANEASLFKVKRKGDKTSLRDSSDKTVYSTHDSVPTIAVAALGVKAADRLAIRAALLTMLAIQNAN